MRMDPRNKMNNRIRIIAKRLLGKQIRRVIDQNVIAVWQDVESEDDVDGGGVDEQAHWQIGWELPFGWKEDAGDIRSPRHGRKRKDSKSGGEAYSRCEMGKVDDLLSNDEDGSLVSGWVWQTELFIYSSGLSRLYLCPCTDLIQGVLEMQNQHYLQCC
jgi:hypothetical protein